jgi:5-methylthioadenosine/S-adenosylhomocysteine deaminase
MMTTMGRRALVHGGQILPSADQAPFIGWINWDDGKITALGQGAPPAEVLDSYDEVIDARGCVVTPGFINAHTHLFQTMLRGVRTDLCLEDWLNATIWPVVGRFTPDDFRMAALLGAVENLRSGATTVFENQYVHTSPENSYRVASALAESGIRATAFHGGTDRGEALAAVVGRDAVDSILTTPARYVDDVDRLAATWHGHDAGRISVGVAAQTAWLCTTDFCETIATYAETAGLTAHAHCAESARSVQGCVDETGLREVEMFDRTGLLRPGTSLAHCVWIEDDEIEMIARSGASVAHCPVSNAYLGSGIAPIPKLLRAGATVALATDGAASNNRQDSFESLKWAVNIQKAKYADAAALTDTQALQMAWSGGAQAMGQPGLLGVLAPGSHADVVIVNLDSSFVTPVHDLVSTLVFGSMPADVRDVFVAGRGVVRDGVCTTVDEVALRRHASTRASELGLRSLRVTA